MGKGARQIGRRAALFFIFAAPMIARRAVADAVAKYSVDVRPARALIGDRLRLGMDCLISRTASVTTFEDASLVLAMARRSSRAEPELAFPNHRAVQQGNRLVRLGGAVRRTCSPESASSESSTWSASFRGWRSIPANLWLTTSSTMEAGSGV